MDLLQKKKVRNDFLGWLSLVEKLGNVKREPLAIASSQRGLIIFKTLALLTVDQVTLETTPVF